MELHQIWFDLGKGASPASPNGVDSMLRYSAESGLTYRLWSEADAVKLMSSMPVRIQKIWAKLPHDINRIDFLRYVIMYKLGGVYFDVDFNCIKNLSDLLVSDTVFLCEEWPFSLKNGSIHNGVLFCKSPGHPFWTHVFDEINNRLCVLSMHDYKDIQKSVFKLTGTSMLRDVSCKYMNEKHIYKVVVLPFGIFCPLICEDSYTDSYNFKENPNENPNRLRVPSNEDITRHARVFTLGYLGASVKIWQRDFT